MSDSDDEECPELVEEVLGKVIHKKQKKEKRNLLGSSFILILSSISSFQPCVCSRFLSLS